MSFLLNKYDGLYIVSIKWKPKSIRYFQTQDERGANPSHRLARGTFFFFFQSFIQMYFRFILLARISIPVRNSLFGERALLWMSAFNLRVPNGNINRVRIRECAGCTRKYYILHDLSGCCKFADPGGGGTMASAKTSRLRRKSIRNYVCTIINARGGGEVGGNLRISNEIYR